jgi:hypothetical protein
MTRWIKRAIWLMAIAVAAAVTARWWAARSIPQPSTNPTWPPFEPPTPTELRANARSSTVADAPADIAVDALADSGVASGTAWVVPVDGECPDGYPIKANDNSGIYHVPGGRFYDRTKPERCYVDAASAAADGYRAAKA